MMGPRFVGKTVLIHHAIQALLDDGVPPPIDLLYFGGSSALHRTGVEQFLESYQEANTIGLKSDACFVFFDEIQYLRDWEIHLKVLVDGYKNIKCCVSGSAAALRLKSIESGAGRFTSFLLPPLTFPEYLELLEQEDFIEKRRQFDSFQTSKDIGKLNERFIHYINFGGYPEVVISKEIQSDPARFIKVILLTRCF